MSKFAHVMKPEHWEEWVAVANPATDTGRCMAAAAEVSRGGSDVVQVRGRLRLLREVGPYQYWVVE